MLKHYAGELHLEIGDIALEQITPLSLQMVFHMAACFSTT